jgi:hypothetical protein
MVVEMNDGWMELTLVGEFCQVNLCQALIDYFAVVIEKRPASPGMMDRSRTGAAQLEYA